MSSGILFIHPEYEGFVPATMKSAVADACSYFDTTFAPTHSVYMNIDFKWAPIDSVGQSSTQLIPGGQNFGNIEFGLTQADKLIPDDKGLVLPSSNPFGGNLFSITDSQEAELGLFSLLNGNPSPELEAWQYERGRYGHT